MDGHRIRALAAVLVLSGGLAACGPQDGTGGSGAAPGAVLGVNRTTAGGALLTETDRAFVAAAAGSGLADMEAALLVAGRTDSPQVRTFAERVHKDHADANIKLSRATASKGMEIPDSVSPDQRRELKELETLSGSELDGAFLGRFSGPVREEKIALFERQARESADEALRDFAQETLSALRSHEQTARSLENAGEGSKR